MFFALDTFKILIVLNLWKFPQIMTDIYSELEKHVEIL